MTHPTIAGLQIAVAESLASVPTSTADEIYALSFFIYNEADDPRLPTLTVGYNTVDQWRASIPKASSSDEAKWNYAFWLQNELLVFGGSDSPTTAAVGRWVADLGLGYSDEEEDADFERCLELGQELTERFVAAVCDIASTLHSDSTVTRALGRPVPIIVHELEYYDEIADQTEACNPPGLAEEFVSWVRSGCR
ncbi:hypothetical protein [Alkalisalibacterium limincola]|uniref:DUF4303 domain-containing protein n=1 Tax=Alkalisalibacterium limincola TaxID=2699169 RepID=A0A5C8KFV2_9GAMM|nr:hypothetical protein [Alkalisalibacterium limincola]TXK59075.1 hypothetical protein FU658_14110 [Alkalisalibacterium limincola]